MRNSFLLYYCKW